VIHLGRQRFPAELDVSSQLGARADDFAPSMPPGMLGALAPAQVELVSERGTDHHSELFGIVTGLQGLASKQVLRAPSLD
jgi:hypothetical protein